MTIVASEPTIPAGMKRWHGGDSAPADWEPFGLVMFRDGSMSDAGDDGPWYWRHGASQSDIVAYTPRAPGEAREEVAQAMAESVGLLWEKLPDKHDMVCGNGMPEGCRDYWRDLAAVAALSADRSDPAGEE